MRIATRTWRNSHAVPTGAACSPASVDAPARPRKEEPVAVAARAAQPDALREARVPASRPPPAVRDHSSARIDRGVACALRLRLRRRREHDSRPVLLAPRGWHGPQPEANVAAQRGTSRNGGVRVDAADVSRGEAEAVWRRRRRRRDEEERACERDEREAQPHRRSLTHARAIGTTKLMFSPAPETRTPTMRPCLSSAGPPEFPGFAAASV